MYATLFLSPKADGFGILQEFLKNSHQCRRFIFRVRVLGFFVCFNVLDSSPIWTCQISNICYCFLQPGAVEKVNTNIRNSTCPNQWATKEIKTEKKQRALNLRMNLLMRILCELWKLCYQFSWICKFIMRSLLGSGWKPC